MRLDSILIVNIPKDNPLTEEKIKLGKNLYFERVCRLTAAFLVHLSGHIERKRGSAYRRQLSARRGRGAAGKTGTATHINCSSSMKQSSDGRAGLRWKTRHRGWAQNPVENGGCRAMAVAKVKLTAHPTY